jgi:hypothetical protein
MVAQANRMKMKRILFRKREMRENAPQRSRKNALVYCSWKHAVEAFGY